MDRRPNLAHASNGAQGDEESQGWRRHRSLGVDPALIGGPELSLVG
jgi:hypothetical protein